MTGLKMRAASAVLCAALLAGCPELFSGASLNGNFSGSWILPAEGDTAQESCPISLELVHFPFANNPLDASEVTGFVNLDFTCFETLQALLEFQNIEVAEIPVVGRIVAGGNFLLRSEDLVGGCNGGLCISLIMTGQALDEDADGVADSLAGEWSAVFPVQLSGTFSADLEVEAEE